jgi:hypothetical protein
MQARTGLPSSIGEGGPMIPVKRGGPEPYSGIRGVSSRSCPKS